MTDVAEIARGLTKAQREAVLAIRPGEERRAIDFSASSARGLVSATNKRPALLSAVITALGAVVWYRHTRDGLAVRDYLKEQE